MDVPVTLDIQQWIEANSQKRQRKFKRLLFESRRQVIQSLMVLIMEAVIDRGLWSKPRSDGFWNVVLNSFTDLD